jgi:hypothetical protein
MVTKIRFLKAINSPRPFKSHRFDVFGPKVNRIVTLFGKNALHAWLMLEATPAVATYCERPMAIPDTKPLRAVDFWVSYVEHEEMWLLVREENSTPSNMQSEVIPNFVRSAVAQGMQVKFVKRDTLIPTTQFCENWGRIIRELSSNGRYISPQVRDRIHRYFVRPLPLSVLPELFPDEDPVILRTTAFGLIHTGKLRAIDIENVPLGPAVLLEAI